MYDVSWFMSIEKAGYHGVALIHQSLCACIVKMNPNRCMHVFKQSQVVGVTSGLLLTRSCIRQTGFRDATLAVMFDDCDSSNFEINFFVPN